MIDPGYVPQEPVTQYKGSDPITGFLTYYKMDSAGVLIARYSESKKKWEYIADIGEIIRPGDLVNAITSNDKAELADQLAQSGMFKPKTQYIIIGDEPSGGSGVVNLESMLEPEDFASIKTYLTFMPRSMLWDFFLKKIHPSLPAKNFAQGSNPTVKTAIYGGWHNIRQYETLVWAAFIDVFNVANLEYVNQQQIEPWTWEAKKLEAYYVSQSKEAIDELAKQFDGARDISLALDPEADKIMKAYMTLPKLGDIGLEINRQNSVKELLKQKEYALAQAIVDAFRYANDTVLGEQLAKPIPFNIADSSGQIVARKS